jgi:hypothetical protein
MVRTFPQRRRAMLKKLFLGTAIALVLATASYAQTYTADDAAQAAKGLADAPNPNDLLNGPGPTDNSNFYSPDGRYAAAKQLYDEVKNDKCRTLAVELAILALSEDSEWVKAYITRVGWEFTPVSGRTKMNHDSDEIEKFLADLKSKPACPTPATPTPAMPGPGSTPQQPPQVDVPQQPQNPDSPPGTCPADVNAIIGLVRLELDTDDAVQRTPAPYWEQVTIGHKCVWRLLYYVRDAEGGYWKSFRTEVLCTDPPPGSSAGGQYCPPSSTGLKSPSGDGTQSPVGRSTPADPIATPLQPLWFRGLTTPDASDDLLNGKSDSDPVLGDPKTAKQPSKTDDKTSEKFKPNDNGDKSDSKSTAEADKSDARSTGNGEHANAKPAGASERAKAKSENSSEHATRTVAHEKPEVSHHIAHTTGAEHIGGVHEGGLREAGKHVGGLGGMHAGGLGGLGTMHPGGLGGLHLGGFGGMHIGGFGRL